MKCLGFLSAGESGMTALYWRLFHEEIRRRSGQRHTGQVVAESLDADELSTLVDPRLIGSSLAVAAKRLERRGAAGILLCSPSLHRFATIVREAVTVPLLHIARATAEKLHRVRLTSPALVGLHSSAGEKHDWQSLLRKSGIQKSIFPSTLDAIFVEDQLRRGLSTETATDEIRAAFTRLSVDLKHSGARIIVFTRPELTFGLREEDSVIPTMCAVQAHCEQAALLALESPVSKSGVVAAR